MNHRIVALYHSMQQAAAVVHSYPELRARAEESRGFDLFLSLIVDFETLLREEASTPLELKQLAARKKRLTADIDLAIDSLITTASLIPRHIALLPLTAPSSRLATFMFTVKARGLVEAAANLAPAFIDAGLHPRTFDDAHALITQLIDADLAERLTLLHADSFPARLEITIEASRKRLRQLTLDLRRAMTAESTAAWRSACALGRTHRPKQLSAPAQPKLLAAPTSGDPAEPQHEPALSDGALKRIARRVGLGRAPTEPA